MEDEQQWQRLLGEQTVLFQKTIQKNADLEARVVELERELAVWKLAFSNTDEEKVALKKQVTKLERNIGSLKDDNPLVVCLIDGDGNIFSHDLVSQGRSGGSQAAQLLTKGITEYLAETEDGRAETSPLSGRAQIWLSVFCNKSGLQETFTSRKLCTADQFESFVMGFNQASPLFSLTDVGNGKEAADTKVKGHHFAEGLGECLRVFTRFPQTCKVFFGGGHDNGYASTLNSLYNEGLSEKIIILRGYRELASELKTLDLPFIEFKGVFLTQKFPVNHSKTFSGSMPVEHEKKYSRSIASNSIPSSPSTTNYKPRYPKSTLTAKRQEYANPCNFYYLAICQAGTACRYGHNYDLDAEDLTVMRVNAKKSPCSRVNKNQKCTFGDRCPFGHMCPSGPTCKFFMAGKCKFNGVGMHDGESPIPRQDPTAGSSSVQPSTAGFTEPAQLGTRTSATPAATIPYPDTWYNKLANTDYSHVL